AFGLQVSGCVWMHVKTCVERQIVPKVRLYHVIQQEHRSHQDTAIGSARESTLRGIDAVIPFYGGQELSGEKKEILARVRQNVIDTTTIVRSLLNGNQNNVQ